MGRSKQLLERIGGVISEIQTEDGESLQSIHLTRKEFNEKVKNRGGRIEGQSIFTHNQGLIQDLERMGFKKSNFCSEKGETVFTLGSQKIEEDESRLMIRCQPGIFSAFDRKYVAKHLALGFDVLLFDGRGFDEKSKFSPSEEGMYLDGKAVFDHYQKHYLDGKIWVSGFCLGGATATYLRSTYAHLGVHLVMENPFHSYEAVIENQGWFASWLGKKLLHNLQAERGSQAAQRMQGVADFFNNERKLRDIKGAALPKAKTIIIDTDTDWVMPKTSAKRLKAAAKKAATVYHITHKGIPGENGHEERPLSNPTVWEEYAEHLIK